jgi:hypothetical protein
MSSDPFGICLEPKCDDSEPLKELPSFVDMAKNLLGSAKDIASGALSGKGVLVDEEVYNTRMNICAACPSFKPETKRCAECGCFMEAKARFKNVSCPIGKW